MNIIFVVHTEKNQITYAQNILYKVENLEKTVLKAINLYIDLLYLLWGGRMGCRPCKNI